jgi:hypothetical protein
MEPIPFTLEEPGPPRPATPLDVLGRLPFELRSDALRPLSEVWALTHERQRATEADRLSQLLERKRAELRERGLDPYSGDGLREYQRFYAEVNPTSPLAQKVLSGDAFGEVPDTHRTIATNYENRIKGMWEQLSDEERQLLEPHYGAVQEAIETLRMDPKAKPHQVIGRLIEFGRQVTAARRFNETMGFKNAQFQESKRRFDEAMALRREAQELREQESKERSEERRLRIRERRERLEHSAERLAIQAFNSMSAFLANLRFMAVDDPVVDQMRKIARDLMLFYQRQFPGLAAPQTPEAQPQEIPLR